MTQAAKYASVSAKIGAERSNLLSKDKLKNLSESKNLNNFVSQLKETVYQQQLLKLTSPYSGRKLERAFQENLIEVYAKIIKNSPESSSAFVTMALCRLEIENIKALAKAVNANIPLEQREALVYLSVEDFLKRRPVFEEAIKASDLKQLSSAFTKNEYASALKYGLESYEESGATTCFDVLVDKTYYEEFFEAYDRLPKKEKRHAIFFASMESSSYILLTLLRGKIQGHDANWLRVIIPDAHFLPNETVEALVTAENFGSAFNLVQQSQYKSYFVKAQSPEETVANAEKAFKNALYKHAVKSQIAEIFNVELPLAFIYQKQAEVNNLITISLGIENVLEPQDIQNLLLGN